MTNKSNKKINKWITFNCILCFVLFLNVEYVLMLLSDIFVLHVSRYLCRSSVRCIDLHAFGDVFQTSRRRDNNVFLTSVAGQADVQIYKQLWSCRRHADVGPTSARRFPKRFPDVRITSVIRLEKSKETVIAAVVVTSSRRLIKVLLTYD